MEKDQNRSWVVVGVGATLLMLLEHTLSVSGLIFRNVDIIGSNYIWLLTIMHSVSAFSALIANPLSEIWTHRKVAMIGCFIAAFGFLMSASTLKLNGWLFFAYGGIVGLGLGLAIHVTYLLVMSNFKKYQGLAIGVIEMSAGIGYIIAPYIFLSNLERAEDRLLVRALCSVIAFVGTILYVYPIGFKLRDSFVKLRTSKNSCIIKSNNKRILDLKETSQEEFSMMEIQDNDADSETFDIQDANKKRSHYLLDISVLPKIIEESEGPSATATGNCTPISRTSFNNLPRLISSHQESEVEIAVMCLEKLINRDVDPTNDSVKPKEISLDNDDIKSHPLRSMLQNCANNLCNNESQPSVQNSSKVISSNDKSSQVMKKKFSDINYLEASVSTEVKQELLPFNSRAHSAFKNIKLDYLKNLAFIKMAIGIVLAEMALPFIPLVVYASLSSTFSSNYQGEGETVLLLMYIVDALSRLVFSYLSDFSWFSRRLGFFVSNLCISIVIFGFGAFEDSNVIYFLCIIYGITKGTLHATKTVMLADTFGMSNFPSTYGLSNCFKSIINILATVLILSPIVPYTFAFHPLTPLVNEQYKTNSNNSEPFELFFPFYNEDDNESKVPLPFLFGFLSIPGFLSFLIWMPGELRLCWRISHTINSERSHIEA